MSMSLATAQEFLIMEAELLDTWKLLEWAELFTEDGEYLVPATDLPEGQPESSLHLIYDNRHRLRERAVRLTKRTAHAEFPRSKTTRIVSNVRIKGTDGDVTRVDCNFVVYRARPEQFDVFPGHSEYELRVDASGSLRIRKKRAVLHLDTLRPQHKVSIIL